MAVPEINPIPKNVSDFVDEIDDVFIRTKLQALIAVAQEPAGTNQTARDVAMVEKATAGWQLAVTNQHASINRLLEERQQLRDKIIALEVAVETRDRRLDKAKVGPE